MAKCIIEKVARAGSKPPTTTIAKIDVSISGTATGTDYVRLYQVGNDADADDYLEEAPVTSLGNWAVFIPLMKGASFKIYASDYENTVTARSGSQTVDWASLIK